jgi:hypothetical protein
MALRATRPLTDMITEIFLRIKGGWHVRLTTSPSLSASFSHNQMGFQGLLHGYLYLFYVYTVIVVEKFENYFSISVVIQMWYSFQHLEIPRANLPHQY